MALNAFVSALIFLSLILDFPATVNSQECVYPCYPQPTSSNPGDSNQLTPPATALTPPTQNGYGYPPPIFFNYPPPTGYLPYTPPYIDAAAPPPPEPILPWWPYYYRKPPHQPDDSSSSSSSSSRTVRREWTAVIAVTQVLGYIYIFCLVTN